MWWSTTRAGSLFARSSRVESFRAKVRSAMRYHDYLASNSQLGRASGAQLGFVARVSLASLEQLTLCKG